MLSANEDEILKLWQGLGYYSRARNLHMGSAIYTFLKTFKDCFPDNYNELDSTLKGIGDYTASAIASICFNENEGRSRTETSIPIFVAGILESQVQLIHLRALRNLSVLAQKIVIDTTQSW